MTHWGFWFWRVIKYPQPKAFVFSNTMYTIFISPKVHLNKVPATIWGGGGAKCRLQWLQLMDQRMANPQDYHLAAPRWRLCLHPHLPIRPTFGPTDRSSPLWLAHFLGDFGPCDPMLNMGGLLAGDLDYRVPPIIAPPLGHHYFQTQTCQMGFRCSLPSLCGRQK